MKKLLAILLIVALTLSFTTACAKKPAGDDTSKKPDTSGASSEPESPPAPPYTPNVLTGLPFEGDYPQTTRIGAVMVNNISNDAKQNARPQWGIGAADMLMEIMVEGGITRFMAMFSDYKSIPKIGPVRSGRDQFFQLILPFQALYTHIGESVVQTQFIKDYDYQTIDINLDAYGFERDQERHNTGVAIEHTAYTDGAQMVDIVQNKGKDDARTYNSTFFNFVNYNDPERELTGDADGNNFVAAKIDVLHSEAYRTYFNYNDDTKLYDMSQYSRAKGAVHDTVDATTNEQLSFKNVLVLFTDIHVYPGHEVKDLQKVDYTFGGVGYYFCNGQAEEVRWMKGAPLDVLRICDKFGNETPVELNPGKTYLSFVDIDMAEGKFAYYPDETAAQGSNSVVLDPNATTDIVDE